MVVYYGINILKNIEQLKINNNEENNKRTGNRNCDAY